MAKNPSKILSLCFSLSDLKFNKGENIKMHHHHLLRKASITDMSAKFRPPPPRHRKTGIEDNFTTEKNICFLDAYQNGLKHDAFDNSQFCNK